MIALLRHSAAAAVALALAAAVSAVRFSEHISLAGDHAAATRYNPLSADDWTRQSAVAYGDGAYEAAAAFARRSLLHSPISADALSILAFSRRERQQGDRADQLMAFAASLSWQSEAAQLTLLQKEVDQREFDAALRRVDALLRQRLRREELFSFLRRLSEEPEAAEPLAKRLALKPRWRSDFLGNLAGAEPEHLIHHGRILELLKRTSNPPSREEVAAFVDRLISNGRFSEARAAWLKLGLGGGAELLSNNFDNLSTGGSPSPFDWMEAPATEVTVIKSSEAASAIHLMASGRPATDALQHTLVAPPGAYRLTIEARAGNLTSIRSLRWKLFCMQDNQPARTATPQVEREAGGWTLLTTRLDVPASGCAGQRLVLRVEHDAAEDLDVHLRNPKLVRTS